MTQAILVIDRDPARCQALSVGLAEFGYEVVPVTDPEQGLRFASALEPWLIVLATSVLAAPDAAAPDAAAPDAAAMAEHPLIRTLGADHSLLVLADRPLDPDALPEGARHLAAAQLNEEELVRRVRLLVLGHDLGLVPDLRLEYLLGDLEQKPFFELVPALSRARVSGRLQLFSGEVFFAQGAVIAAEQGSASGLKAFFRLAMRSEGPFRLAIGAPGRALDRALEIDLDVDSLMMQTVKDSLGEMPEPGIRLELKIEPALIGNLFEPFARELLSAIDQGDSTLGKLLDRLPATDGVILQQLLELKNCDMVGFIYPQPKVAVVTDSAADLPAKLAQGHQLQIVPLTSSFGPVALVDGRELSAQSFYERLVTDSHPPATAPPSTTAFREVYAELWPQREVFSLHISAKLSKTFEHAQAAAQRLAASVTSPDQKPLRVYDTGQVSLAQGLLALFAARMAARGLAAGEITERLLLMEERLHLLFVVNTLDYLVRGGRIGRARAWVGKLLGVKPILGIGEGEVLAIDRARGGRKAQQRLVALLLERVDRKQPVIVAIGHAQAPAWADSLYQLLAAQLQIREHLVTQIGPVVGTHTGPGTVGVAVFQPTADELVWIAPI